MHATLAILLLPLLALQPGPEKPVFQRVERGEVVQEVVERGEVEPLRLAEVICRVRGGDGKAVAIKQVAEEGAFVKKGEVVAEVDDSGPRQRLQAAEAVHEAARAAADAADRGHRAAKQRATALVEDAQDRLAVAGLDQAAAKGAEAQKASLVARIARRALDLAKLDAEALLAKAEAERAGPIAALREARAKLEEARAELAGCRLLAPQDGMVIHYHHRNEYQFESPASAAAVGELAREGQQLLVVADLTRMRVRIKVHESQVGALKVGMPAKVETAFGGRDAKVGVIAGVAAPSDRTANAVKTFAVLLDLEGENDDSQIRPGLSAEAMIRVAARKDVPRVPIQCVRARGQERICFVKEGAGVAPRPVKLGLAGGPFVEILAGLEVGEEVCLNPPPLPPEGPAPGRPKPGELTLRSVAPKEETRTFTRRYGLTETDLAAVRAALPDLVAAVPVRRAASEVRATLGPTLSRAEWVATTPGLFALRPRRLAAGRPLADLDEEAGAAVAVLGSQVAADLFPGTDLLGQTVHFPGKTPLFRVVGTLAPTGNAAADSQVFIPFRAARSHFGEVIMVRAAGRRGAEAVQMHELLLQLPDVAAAQRAKAVVTALLELRRPERDWAVEASRAGTGIE